MRIKSQDIPGLLVVETEPHRDERGAFGRLFCSAAFANAGVDFTPVQVNLSANVAALTLRGMHFQAAPFEEDKFVHVVRGRAYDVAVDLRPSSPTYRHWFGIELDAQRLNGVFIPRGCAHGFLTLENDTDLLYHMGQPYEAPSARGVRWNDPAFGVEWPAVPRVISERDATYPDFAF